MTIDLARTRFTRSMDFRLTICSRLAAVGLTHIECVFPIRLAWQTRGGGGITQAALGGCDH